MKNLIMEIVKHLVDNPDEIQINEITGQGTDVFELRVAKSDIGKVIGKQGRTAQSIRAILNAASAKNRKRVMLEILE